MGHAVQRDGDEEDKEDEECENTVLGGEESDLAGTIFRDSGIR